MMCIETAPNVVYTLDMKALVTHDRHDESIEQKARWFQSLPLSERMEMLCSFTDLALQVKNVYPFTKFCGH